MWQALPAVAGWRTATESRAQDESFWYPVIAWLGEHPEPDHRVQVVATADNWEAFYLARRGVPLARGWFRQDDFPANARALRDADAPAATTRWLRRTGVHYVFLPDDPLDYSAGNEATLLRSGRLRACDEVARIGGWTVFELPEPTPIATPADGISIDLADLRTPSPCASSAPAPTACGCATRPTGAWSRARACATPREPWGTDLRVHEPRDRAPVVRRPPGHLRGRGPGQRRAAAARRCYGPPAPVPAAPSSN